MTRHAGGGQRIGGDNLRAAPVDELIHDNISAKTYEAGTLVFIYVSNSSIQKDTKTL